MGRVNILRDQMIEIELEAVEYVYRRMIKDREELDEVRAAALAGERRGYLAALVDILGDVAADRVYRATLARLENPKGVWTDE